MIKTIKLETEDDHLFSKSAPLLAAASELAYHTVHCSALNAEELRREGGLDVLLEAYTRCVSVLNKSSKQSDVAVQVCTHITRCFAVAGTFRGCREKMVELGQLIKDLCRILHFKVSLLFNDRGESAAFGHFSVYIFLGEVDNKELKKGCESGFPYCFLTEFTKFFL